MTEPEMRPDRADAIRAMLVDHVSREPAVRAARRRRRVIGWGGLGVLAAGVAVTAGTVLLAPGPVTQSTYVQCLSEPTRAADGSYPGSGASVTESDEQWGDPIQICTLMWEQGLFEPGYDPLAEHNPPGRVPEELQLCVMEDGTAAVVPSPNESICAALGMAPPTG
ncbi:hypothetical protein [Agromyces italicus]|uniref:hypothetical protein n=1 Tax=Agromyces italicus TaxID=279572 RepID=UPI0003B489D6|nr:hypothetical protein [Agromyces italicus]